MPMQPPAGLDIVDHIQQTRDSYAQLGYDSYRWADEPDPSAFVRSAKPLAESNVALIASGGVYQAGQIAFHHKDDTSYRRIPTDTPTADLRTSHFAYDMTNARVDPNVVFPIDALRAMVERGAIGSLTTHALTFMGGIYSQRRLTEELIPALTDEVGAMEPDVVLLVPVWPVCHQSVGLIARHLESQGFATTSLSSSWSITASANPPRAAFLDYPLGHTAGRPNELDEQISVVTAALQLIETADSPGHIAPLPHQWPTEWKAKARELSDKRTDRFDTPQYERPSDAVAAASTKQD